MSNAASVLSGWTPHHYSAVVAILALVVSITSMFIAAASFRRTSRFQDADYVPRINAEHGAFYWPLGQDKDIAVRITFSLQNAGQKPVTVERVSFRIGDEKDQTRYHTHGISSYPRQALPQGQKSAQEQIDILWDEIESAAKVFNIHLVAVFLSVRYLSATGEAGHLLLKVAEFAHRQPVITMDLVRD